MKIKIIFPSWLDPSGRPLKTKARVAKVLNLSFIYLAGLTPKEHEVEVIDDFFEEIDFEEPVDLVALTAMTSQAPRAYQIAEEYRKRGVKTVMGGFHASFCPGEAGEKVDAVVIGEAEPVWAKVLQDAESGQLKKFYQAPLLPSLAGLPPPKYELVKGKVQRYQYYPLWLSRGCNLNCKFCSVSAFYQHTYRARPIPDILQDASQIPTHRVFIIDDSLSAYGKDLKRLLPELAKFRFRWFCQLDSRSALDEELIELAAFAGMECAYIGFESIFPDQLKSAGKAWAKLDQYGKAVKNLQRYGVIVNASLIFGIGPENRETVKQALEFLVSWKIDTLSLYFYTPAPGTRLFEELIEQGVNFSKNWALYDGTHPIIIHQGMTKEQLEELYWSLYQGFYSIPNTFRRFLRFPYNLKFWASSLGRNLLIFRVDVNRRRSMLYNGVSFLDLLPWHRSDLPG